MTSKGDNDIDALVSDVFEASKLPAKKRGTSIKPTVERLASAINNEGLEENILIDVLNLITAPSHLDQASRNVLLSNLYPSSKVSSDATLKVVGSLGVGQLKASFSVQGGLLRWLILVYHVLESPSILSQSYSVLFNLLDVAAIRPHLCHVLALITRRKHVRPFRIQAVLNLSRQTGNDPALVGLLRIYKDYYPEIIVAEAVRGKASAFKHPDLSWRERLDDIQRQHAQKTVDAELRAQNGFSVNRGLSSRARGPRASGIPMVHTSLATENSVTLEEIDSPDRFANSLEKIELPNQIAAFLADPLLQKLLMLKTDPATSQRVAHWIDALLDDILAGDADEKAVEDALDILSQFVATIKETPPRLLNFLSKFLSAWDGSIGRYAVLRMLSYASLGNFDDLREHLFEPLERSLPASLESQIFTLQMYRDLLRHWTTSLKSLDEIPDNALPSIRALQNHAGKVALNIVQAAPSLRTHGAILDFYEQAAATMGDRELEPSLRIATPISQVVYLIFFSHSLGNISRLAGILAEYKTAFDAAMGRNRSAYGTSDLRPFNGFLMDLCNCLWRGRALNASDTNALGCTLARGVKAHLERYVESLGGDLVFPRLFELSHSPVLSLLSIMRVRQLEDEADASEPGGIRKRHAGPVTQISLQKLAATKGLHLTWPEYRLNVLLELEAQGINGIPALMRNVMKVLQNTPAPSQASRAM